jgi:hypothetical protein
MGWPDLETQWPASEDSPKKPKPSRQVAFAANSNQRVVPRAMGKRSSEYPHAIPKASKNARKSLRLSPIMSLSINGGNQPSMMIGS